MKRPSDLCRKPVQKELGMIKGMLEEGFSSNKLDLAVDLFARLITDLNLDEWLTLPAYEQLD